MLAAGCADAAGRGPTRSDGGSKDGGPADTAADGVPGDGPSDVASDKGGGGAGGSGGGSGGTGGTGGAGGAGGSGARGGVGGSGGGGSGGSDTSTVCCDLVTAWVAKAKEGLACGDGADDCSVKVASCIDGAGLSVCPVFVSPTVADELGTYLSKYTAAGCVGATTWSYASCPAWGTSCDEVATQFYGPGRCYPGAMSSHCDSGRKACVPD